MEGNKVAAVASKTKSVSHRLLAASLTGNNVIFVS